MRFARNALGLSFGVFLMAACQAPVLDSETSETPVPQTGAPLPFGTQHFIQSDVYTADREINIYVPEIPAWGEGYFVDPLPVLYVIDGGADQDFFHIAGLSQLTIINGERQPMIVVGVRTHNRRQEIVPDPQHPDYQRGDFQGFGGSEEFRRFLLTEVKPYVESKYNVERDAVIGESLAGLFIVETFLKSPDSFDDYIAVSPSLWWDDRNLAKDAPNLLAQHQLSDRRLYLTMADEGGTMRLGLEEILSSLSKHPETATVKFVDRANQDSHSTIYHHSARDALSWMYGIPAQPYGETPWYLEVGGTAPD